MSGWGLVGSATANSPLKTLEEIIATKQAEEEMQRKIAVEKQKLGMDERRLGLETQRTGFEGQRVGLDRDKFTADTTAAQAAEQRKRDILAKLPEWLKPSAELRDAFGMNVEPRDAAFSPQQQRENELGDQTAAAAAKAAAKAEEDARALKNAQTLRGTPTYSDLHPDAPKPDKRRSVFSSDANRISDLDTSLNDLSTLTEVLKETEGATGTMASIGASTPNWVNSAMGAVTGNPGGLDSVNKPKQRQAVIDRVKQVIGKALEGGVLRKEDEIKYTKILPTISDSQSVAESKLAGLDKAIRQHRQTLLESLGDAGFDVENFATRGAARAPAAVPAAGKTAPIQPKPPVRVVNPDGSVTYKRGG
jgi:hypothetical protein